MRQLLPRDSTDWASKHWTHAVTHVCSHMVHSALLFPKLCTHYLELWCTLREAWLHRPSAPTWTWWLDVCRRELQNHPTARDIQMGHRLLTHTTRIFSHTQNISAPQEIKDPLTAVMRRVWPGNCHPNKLRENLNKLCSTTGNTNDRSRRALRADLHRIVAAFRMGWMTKGPGRTRTCGEHMKEYKRFRSAEQWFESPADEPDVVEALQEYLIWYIQNCGSLRSFLAQQIPAWTRFVKNKGQGSVAASEEDKGQGTVTASELWLPEQSFGVLLRITLVENTLRGCLLKRPDDGGDDTDGASASYWQDLEQQAHAVFDARQQLTLQQTQGVSDAVLDCATWSLLGDKMLLSDALVQRMHDFTKDHYARSNIKTGFKSFIRDLGCRQNTEFRDLAALQAIFRVLKQRQLCHAVPVPYQWARSNAQTYEAREAALGVTMSPMCDVFMYCPTCLRVCSICAPNYGSPFDAVGQEKGRNSRRRKKTTRSRLQTRIPLTTTATPGTATSSSSSSSQTTVSGEPIFSAGFRHVVSDVETGRYLCALRKTGSMSQKCKDSELQQVHLTGKILVFDGSVYALCPQPNCARIMQLEPSVCRYTAYGPCCSVCAALFSKTSPTPPPPPTLPQPPAFEQSLAKVMKAAAKAKPKKLRVISFFEDDE